MSFWYCCITWKPPCMRGLPQRGKTVLFRSLSKKTWASLSLDDFKAPELEYVMLRSLQAQEAWARGRYGQSGFSQVFMAETYFSRQTKFPSAAVASNSTHGRQYKLSLQRGSTAVLDCSGSECSRLPCTSILRFSLLLSSPDSCPYLLLSRLLILILQRAWLFYYLLAECNCLQFSRLKRWSSFENCNGTSPGWNRPWAEPMA